MWMSGCSSTICWKDYLCSLVLPLLLCQRPVDCICGSRSEFYIAQFAAESPGELLSKCRFLSHGQSLLSRIFWKRVWGICILNDYRWFWGNRSRVWDSLLLVNFLDHFPFSGELLHSSHCGWWCKAWLCLLLVTIKESFNSLDEKV